MTNMESQIISRLLINIPESLNLLNLMMLSEIVPSRYRPVNTCFYWLFWCTGYAVCSGVAKLFPDWRYIHMSMYIPMLVYPLFLYMVPESPRWLSLKKRHQEAFEVYKRISRFNGGTFDTNKYKVAISKVIEERKQKGELVNALKSPIMRYKFAIFLYVYWVIGISYFGLAIHASFATNDIFLNGLLNGVIEIPSYFLSWKCLEWWGRKNPFIGAIFFCGITVVVVPFLPETGTYWAIRTVVAMAGKLLLTLCYSAKDVYLAEISPTSIRSSVVFVASCLLGVASLVAPFVLGWSTDNLYFLAGVLFGAHALICSFLLLFLPDTYDCPLAQTVEEADMLLAGKENIVRIKYANANKGEITSI